jgi:hypothetical protein
MIRTMVIVPENLSPPPAAPRRVWRLGDPGVGPVETKTFFCPYRVFFPHLRVYLNALDAIILGLEVWRNNRFRPPAGKGAPARENTMCEPDWIWIYVTIPPAVTGIPPSEFPTRNAPPKPHEYSILNF